MRRALTCLAIILAQPALALSCLPADIARDFNRAAQSDDSYIVVRGDLFFDETELPGNMELDATAQREGREIAGWLKGKSLTRDGFTKTFERDVVLRVSCIGPWCGGAAKGPYLTFLRQEGRNWIMDLHPCPGMSYADPTPEQEQSVRACLRGAPCAAD